MASSDNSFIGDLLSEARQSRLINEDSIDYVKQNKDMDEAVMDELQEKMDDLQLYITVLDAVAEEYDDPKLVREITAMVRKSQQTLADLTDALNEK